MMIKVLSLPQQDSCLIRSHFSLSLVTKSTLNKDMTNKSFPCPKQKCVECMSSHFTSVKSSSSRFTYEWKLSFISRERERMSVDYSDVQMCESYVHFLPHTRERERREHCNSISFHAYSPTEID